MKQENTDKVILGIDPGTRILGFGVIHITGKKLQYEGMGIVNLKSEKDHFVTLKLIMQEVSAIIEKYNPDELAIEAPFYGKNPQVMLKLGRAQGAAIAAALVKNIPIFEYAPRSVKLAITGKGAASKEQVSLMAQRLLNINFPQKYMDATDALAIALCHYYHGMSLIPASSKGGDWAQFVKNNPGKIKNF